MLRCVHVSCMCSRDRLCKSHSHTPTVQQSSHSHSVLLNNHNSNGLDVTSWLRFLPLLIEFAKRGWSQNICLEHRTSCTANLRPSGQSSSVPTSKFLIDWNVKLFYDSRIRMWRRRREKDVGGSMVKLREIGI